jgi:hypothetical protein
MASNRSTRSRKGLGREEATGAGSGRGVPTPHTTNPKLQTPLRSLGLGFRVQSRRVPAKQLGQSGRRARAVGLVLGV